LGCAKAGGRQFDGARGRSGASLWRDNLDWKRIASPELLPKVDPLPHVICSPPELAGGGEYEADQHDDT